MLTKIKRKLRLFLLGTEKIRFGWYVKIKWRTFFSRKIKVGFGPITTGENDLAERKWRIDPIIDKINQKKGKFTAGFFVQFDQMKSFDIIVIVKKIHPELIFKMQNLKGKKFIYDIVDNPNDEEQYRYYFRQFPNFISKINTFILSSPVHEPLMKKLGKRALLIEHPILNPTPKRTERNDKEIRILAQGYYENLQNLQWLEPLLPYLSEKTGKTVRLYYHSEKTQADSQYVKYVKWSVSNCFSMMESADIAITIKDLFKPHQYTKPSTKVIAYMAAALPVICKPSAADRLVIRDRIDGFFAYRKEDWIRWLLLLASQPKLRRQTGTAARNNVIKRYSLNQILEKYLHILNFSE